MRIANFFQPIKDSENLDVTTQITVPDQSLSVRDILSRFTRGQMDIPPVITGEDDDINGPVDEFEDLTDALDSIGGINRQLMEKSLKNAVLTGQANDDTQQGEVKEEPKPEPQNE